MGMGFIPSPLRLLRYTDECIRLYNEQGPGDSGISSAYFDAAQIAIVNGEFAKGHIFIERAAAQLRTSSGSDCKEVHQYSTFALEPGKLFRALSKRSKTTVDEVPSGLGEKDFDRVSVYVYCVY